MPFIPWSQQAALPPGAPQEAPPREKGWWGRGAERFEQAGGWTWPWQAEHYAGPWGPAAAGALGAAGLAGGALLGGVGIPAAASWLSGIAPGLTAAALPFVSHPTLLGLGGALTGYGAAQTMIERPPEPPPLLTPEERAAELAQFAPDGGDGITLPPPGGGGAPEPLGGASIRPQVIEVGGQTFWWNPTGGIGEGGWDLISARAPELTPEQQITMTEEQQAHQMEMLQLQYQLEQQAMGAQAGFSQQQQQQAVQQQMAQMFAADPYKYWAQMGQGTPGAVAQLTGGQIAPGEEFGATPLSTPSAQWWGGLLPSEQQQIAGGLNWMGIDPQDWYSIYQRMIPGLGQRQVTPAWAR